MAKILKTVEVYLVDDGRPWVTCQDCMFGSQLCDMLPDTFRCEAGYYTTEKPETETNDCEHSYQDMPVCVHCGHQP